MLFSFMIPFSNMKISVVIPNFNGKDLLEKNLPKIYEELKNYQNGNFEIIVVDDASTDDSVSYLKGLSKDYNSKILVNEKNLGFSPTVNKGVKVASGEIIILLNTDICPEKGFLEPLLSHFTDEKVFAVGCLDKSIEGEKTILRGRGLGEWKRGFLVHRRGEVDKNNTLWVSGGSGAFRKAIWDRLGGLNELYAPFYWEDIDISYRALKSGYKIMFEPKSIVVHEHEKGAIQGKFSQSQIKAIAYKNQFIFVWENADLDLLFSHILWLPYHKLKALLRFDWPFFQGLLKAFILLPKVIVFRRREKKLFVKIDIEVIQELA
jgi:GT2 family glycosyltransferase